jgi:hypothetical protein
MKHPTPSDFLVEVKEAYVSVIFKPSDSHYSFGRLADPRTLRDMVRSRNHQM